MKGRPYQPSNGTEGIIFHETYCTFCVKDVKFRKTEMPDDGCPIIVNTMIFSPGEKAYPKEFIYNDQGEGICTAYELELSDEEKKLKRAAELRKIRESAGQMNLLEQ